MIPALLMVIGGWLLVFCVLAGWGQFVRRLFRLTVAARWFDSFWIGFVLVIAVLEGWHLLLPIDWRITLILAVIGLVGFFWAIFERGVTIQRAPWLRIGLTLLALIPISVWIASRALNAQVDFDTAMYHLSTIHWLNVYPVVPGIGNLHYRLAFNQSFFMFVAALNVYPFLGEGIHLGNSLLMIVALAQSLNSIAAVAFRERAMRHNWPFALFDGLWLPILLYRAVYQYDSANMSSPSPDLSVFILQFVVISAFIRWLFDREQAAAERRFLAFFVIAVSAAGISSKLSFAGFAVVTVGLLLVIWLWQNRRYRLWQTGRRAVVWSAAIGVLLIVPWIGNGLISSGYPLFPSTFGAIPVDYRVPAATAIDAADWVRSFARDPHGDMQTVLNGWDWLPTWEAGLNDNLRIFLFVQPFYLTEDALVAYALLLLLTLLIRRQRWRLILRGWVPLIPALFSAIFWFWSAPDPRFAGSVFWIMLLWTLIMAYHLLIGLAPLTRRLAYPALIVVIGMAAVLLGDGLQHDFRTDGDGFPPIPQVPITQFQTNSGLLVNVSANPDDTLELWDAPLPASPYKIPELELRGTDLRDGFRMAATPSP